MFFFRFIPSLKYLGPAFILLFFHASAFDLQACRQDYDCSTGAKCIKPGSSEYGVCLGGDNPGRSGDNFLDPDPVDQFLGVTCSQNLNCTQGNICFKTGDSDIGACIPRTWLNRKDVKNLNGAKK